MPAAPIEVGSLVQRMHVKSPGTSHQLVLGKRSRQLQQALLKAISGSRHREEALSAVLRVLMDTLRPAGILYCQYDENKALVAQPRLSPAGTGNIQETFGKRLLALCDEACQTGSSQIKGVDGKNRLLAVAAPVMTRGKPPEAVGTLFPTGSLEITEAVGVLQVVAAHITLWDVLEETKATEHELKSTSALLELLGKCESCPGLSAACITLVNELKEFLDCQLVAVGLCGLKKTSCHLQAVAGLSQFDKRSEFAATLEAALDEAIWRDQLTVWPAEPGEDTRGALAHRRACEVTDSEGIISSPLYDEQGTVVGAWMFLGKREFVQTKETVDFMHASQRQVGSSLQLLQRADMNPVARATRAALHRLGSWKIRAALMAVCVVAVALCVPVTYRVGCDCQIQPVVRRFVVAPYEGQLDKTMVEPGDEVARDQLLALLDGRELRWELAGLEAEINRAEKSRDAALAIDDVAEAQQAGLEVERLQLKMELLENRLTRLEVRSPLAGIVISGDLKKTEGAPLSVGEALFEISPLDRMIVEVEIPEREILHVAEGMEVLFRVDAYPGRKWSGTIARIFPRAEVRENESVYVAEVNLDNRSGELRPGMKGRAKAMGARHAWGWNLFHKPYESLCMLVGW